MATVEDVLSKLRERARPEQLEGMARFGISIRKRLGVAVPEMRKLAKELGKDHELALKLWDTGFSDARIVAAMVAEPDKLTAGQMEAWVKDFDSWDVCDQVCMNLFEKTPLIWKKIHAWADREEEFVKRAAFAAIACVAWHFKEVKDDRFTELFPLMKQAAPDDRNYVKKAVSWALRNIGKRNRYLNGVVLAFAQEIGQTDAKAARWIASDVRRDMQSEATLKKIGNIGKSK